MYQDNQVRFTEKDFETEGDYVAYLYNLAKLEEEYGLSKFSNMKLGDAYSSLGKSENKIKSVYSCYRTLELLEDRNSARYDVIGTITCKDKLCAICSRSRSRKLYHKIIKTTYKALEDYPKARFIFLTLTQKNVSTEKLEQTMKEMSKGFWALFRRKQVKDNVLGFVRGTEVTYNAKRNDYHPHIHVLLMVKASYFKKGYITKAMWADLWQSAMKLDYKPVVDIRTVKPREEDAKMSLEQAEKETYKMGIARAVAEVSKYPVKLGIDFENVEVIESLSQALFRKRQTALGGVFKEIAQGLFLDDEEDVEDELPKDYTGRLATARYFRQKRRHEIVKFDQIVLCESDEGREKQIKALRKAFGRRLRNGVKFDDEQEK